MKSIPWRSLVLGGLFLALTGAVVTEGVVLARLYSLQKARAAAPPALALAAADQVAPSKQPGSAPPRLQPDWSFDDREPFADMAKLQQQMQHRMQALWSQQDGATGAAPQVRLSEQPDRYVLRIHEPALAQARVHVDAQEHEVTLRIERNSDQQAQGQDSASQTESEQASVESFGLSHAVDAAKMRIQQQGDTVTVTLPKARSS